MSYFPLDFWGSQSPLQAHPPSLNSQTPSLSPGSSSGRGFTTEVMTTNSLIRDDSWRFCFYFFVGGAFGKGKETRCSFWMEMVLVVVIVLIGKKPCWSWVFGHPLLVPLGASQPEVFVFSGRVVQVFQKTQGVFGDHPQNMSFVVMKFWKKTILNHL